MFQPGSKKPAPMKAKPGKGKPSPIPAPKAPPSMGARQMFSRQSQPQPAIPGMQPSDDDGDEQQPQQGPPQPLRARAMFGRKGR